MYGTALLDLYSTNYNESTSRKSSCSNDGNGNPSTILRNKKTTVVKEKKSFGLRDLLFDSSPPASAANQESASPAYHTLSEYPHTELLVNISEEETPTNANERQPVDQATNKRRSEYKSSSDGCKIRPLIAQMPTSSSMLLNNEIKLRTGSSQHQIDFGKVIARFPMIYVGQKFLDKKYTLPMLPWLVAEFRWVRLNFNNNNNVSTIFIPFSRREVLPLEACSPLGSNSSTNSSASSTSFGLLHGPTKKERKKIWFEITDRCILGVDRQKFGIEQLSKSFTADSEQKAFSRMNVLNEGYLFLHKNNWICKIQPQPHEDQFAFAYLTRDFGSGFGQNNENKPYTLHVFECEEKQIVSVCGHWMTAHFEQFRCVWLLITIIQTWMNNIRWHPVTTIGHFEILRLITHHHYHRRK